jgi:hypothetical protein
MNYLVAVCMCLVITRNYHAYQADDLVVIHQPGCILLPIILPGDNEEYLIRNNLGQIKFFSVLLHLKYYNYTYAMNRFFATHPSFSSTFPSS